MRALRSPHLKCAGPVLLRCSLSCRQPPEYLKAISLWKGAEYTDPSKEAWTLDLIYPL